MPRAARCPPPSSDNLNFASDDKSVGEDGAGELPFFSRIVVNRNDPNRLAIATNYAYTTTDARARRPGPPDQSRRDRRHHRQVLVATALAYGTQDDVDALLVGSTFTTGTPDNPVGNDWLAAGQPHDAAHAPGQLRRRCADLRGIR